MFRCLTRLTGALLALSAGCSTDAAAHWQVRALTFNAALAPGFEPQSNERFSAVVSALQAASLTLDVLCVQEFWVNSQFSELTHGVAHSLPYVVHPKPVPGRGGCTSDELGAVAGCVQSACRTASSEARVGCIQSQCAPEVESVSGGCLGCLINHLDDFPQCTVSGDGAAPGDPAIFGGDFDTGLLSRYRPTESEVLPLDAYFQRGAVLYARIEVPQLGPVHTFCTHLSSPLGVIPYGGPLNSWADEQQREVEQLLSFIAEKAGTREPVLVLGDLNMGLALDGAGAVLPDHFQRLLDSGLRDPFLDSGQAQCSECNDDTWRAPDTPNDLIDHVLIQRFPKASARVSRVFTEPVRVTAASPGTPAATMNLSDHYGLRLELSAQRGGG